MVVIGLQGHNVGVIQALFNEITSILNKHESSSSSIIWIEDTGTVPFQILANQITASQLSRIQYIRVFDLQGYIDTLHEIPANTSTLILSNFGNMCKSGAYFDETKGNNIVSDIMLKLRQLSEPNSMDAYVVGVDGMVGYYLDDVLNV